MVKQVLLAALGCCAVAAAGEVWTQRRDLQDHAATKRPHPVLRGVVNLDAPPEHRWVDILTAHKQQAKDVMEYLKSFLPEWVQPGFFAAMRHALTYKGFPDDYRTEIEAVAKSMEVDVGIVVMGNLLYELEGIGIKCSEYNTTAPCKSHATYDPASDMIFPFRMKGSSSKPGPEGLCTSVVAQDASGKILHGRNLDWDLPIKLRQLLIDVVYQRGAKTVFVGSGLVGYVGILTAMKPGGYSWSLNARDHGGNTVANLLYALSQHGTPSAMKARQVFETVPDFESAVKAMASGDTINGAYFTMAGIKAGEGVVITRGRQGAEDLWRLNVSEPSGWYRLQTNYDHWKPVPTYDDRRGPGYKMMNALQQSGVNLTSLQKVIHTWPVFNAHTDFQAMIEPSTGFYHTTWWDDGDEQIIV